MNKPINPNIIIPEGFAINGVKTDFDNNKILNGFDRIQPDVLAGDNLNKFIDDTYKGLNYSINSFDYLDEKLKSSITNCLLEVPNNINLELNNGVLTLKAGSKVIVPNGFEQDGVTPKFDEVTIENDITNSETPSSTRTVTFWLTADRTAIGIRPLANCYSGSTRPSGQSSMTWYNTVSNIMETTSNSGSTWITGQSFPLGIATVGSTGFTSINQIFNGFGYIGSTIWADKGIKGLIPNGRNADGSLNNTEYTTENITVINTNPLSDRPHFLVMLESQPNIVIHGSDVFSYNPEQNYNFYSPQNVDKTIYSGLIAGTLTFESGQITGLTTNNALNINAMCDGQWVCSYLNAFNSTAVGTYQVSLADYLPKDGYLYEVIVSARTASTTTNNTFLGVSSDILNSGQYPLYIFSNNTTNKYSQCTIPVGNERVLIAEIGLNKSQNTNVYVHAYRRIGTNS